MYTSDGMGTGVVLGVALAVLMGLLACSEKVGVSLQSEGKRAVAQCEENLPRNQYCEVVISAKVVKGEL